MKKTIWMAAVAALSFTAMSCGNSMEDKIEGKYEMDFTPGATYEFASGGKFMNETKPESMDCTIKSPGTWEVKGDSLYITTDTKNVTFEYGSGVSEDEKAILEGITKGMAEMDQQKLAYKIISVDDKELKVEAEGTPFTYKRIK